MLGFQNINTRQISSQPVVVEAITNDKAVFDVETYFFDGDIKLHGIWFPQKSDDLDGFGVASLQVVQKIMQCSACVHNILYDDDAPSFYQAFVKSHDGLYFSDALGAGVGGEFDKIHFTVTLELPHQVGGKNKGPAQYAYKKRVVVLVLKRKFGAELLDAGLHLFFCKQWDEVEVMQFDHIV